MNESSEALMEGIREGDGVAYHALVRRHWSLLVAYAVQLVGERDEAQDVVQEAFIRIWSRRSEWSAPGSASAYLYRITRNFALNRLRDRQAIARREAKGGRAAASEPIKPDLELDRRLLEQEVDIAIQALPERRREVFVLSRFHGMSHREIAEVMGISSQTVANQMSAALDQLRQALARRIEDR